MSTKDPLGSVPTVASVAGWALIITAAALARPVSARSQVPAEFELRDGKGSALVRNASRSETDVEVALWESDETGERVELLENAVVNIWPTEFRLQPGETQIIRFIVDPEAYTAGTMLRLETRFIPVEATKISTSAGSTPDGADARLRLVTRILSKVWIR